MKLLRILPALLLVFVLSLAACSNANGDAEKTKAAKTTVQNPNAPKAGDFALATLDGKNVTLKDYSGKVLILDMWDTWCPPCKAEIPHFIELYDQYNNKGLEILGVAFGRYGEQEVKNFVRDFGINYSSALATQELMMNYGPVNSIPTTFVIDQDGRIYKKYIGYRDKSVFEEDIKTLLGL